MEKRKTKKEILTAIAEILDDAERNISVQQYPENDKRVLTAAENCIDRQKAIDAQQKAAEDNGFSLVQFSALAEVLRKMPSAFPPEPSVTFCEECRFWYKKTDTQGECREGNLVWPQRENLDFCSKAIPLEEDEEDKE